MANNITVKDATPANVVLKSTDNAGVHTPHHNVDTLPALPAGTNNIGDVDVASITVPSSLVHGQTTVTTAGTEVALASTTTLKSGVTIKALAANTGVIYVGGNPVTSSTGFALAAGEHVFLEIDDPATIYIDASVNGEGVSYIGS